MRKQTYSQRRAGRWLALRGSAARLAMWLEVSGIWWPERDLPPATWRDNADAICAWLLFGALVLGALFLGLGYVGGGR